MKKLLAGTTLALTFLCAGPSFAGNALQVGGVGLSGVDCTLGAVGVGNNQPIYVDQHGRVCVNGTFTGTITPTGTQDVNLKQVGGATFALGSALSASSLPVVIASDQAALPVTTTPTARTIIALDVATVTTGGTAVTALTAGHRTAGGFLVNPKGATIDLCINEQTTASGTTTAGGLICIAPAQSYTLAPSALAVSVITSDSSHPFGGYGLN